jgi:hypothetical protein
MLKGKDKFVSGEWVFVISRRCQVLGTLAGRFMRNDCPMPAGRPSKRLVPRPFH